MATGHGQVGHRRKLLYAHRVSYEHAFGPVPDGMCVCHKCDNPPCVRPDHLFLGTLGDNIRDMWSKGRQRPNSISAKLTADEVRQIRSRYATGRAQTALAAEFQVSQMTISKIVRRETWKHVD